MNYAQCQNFYRHIFTATLRRFTIFFILSNLFYRSVYTFEWREFDEKLEEKEMLKDNIDIFRSGRIETIFYFY